MKKSHLGYWKVLPIWLILLSTVLIANSNEIVSVSKFRESTTETTISLCAKLNKYIYTSDGNRAKEYIKLVPNDYFKVTIDYDGICIRGLRPRTNYTVSINKNIPIDSFRLDKDYIFTKSTTDYDPSIRFKDSGYILPSHGEITIPLESTNTDKVAISLYRINENNLIRNINDYGLVRTLNTYSLEKLAEKDGYFLWQKRIKLKSDPNQKQITALPIGEHLKERKPGVYILNAQFINEDDEVIDYYETTTQWFMISDIGLYTLRTDDGLHIYTKKLSNAEPYNNIKLELISKNNEVLDSTISKNGEALFLDKLLKGKRGLTPKAIYAYGDDGDFSVLDLSRSPHDLSDRGVGGRDNPGKYDAFIYSSRGIFRPNETIPIHILVRDSLHKAQSGLKLSLKLFDSKHEEILSKIVTTDRSGYMDIDIPISETANRGKWHIKLYADSDRPIGQLSFLVEDFVPPKIKIDIEKDVEKLVVDQESTIEAKVSYLNGTPLADAIVDGSIILYQAKNPFKGYEAYSFGDTMHRFKNYLLTNFDDSSDGEGRVSLPILVEDIPKTTHPLSAHITISASEPGGRPMEMVLDRSVESADGYIGVKPNFENRSVDIDSNPSFDVVYLKNKKLHRGELNYVVVEEQVDWNWRSNGNGWEYYKTYSDSSEMMRGTITTSDSEPTNLILDRVDWGDYRLELRSGDRVLTTYRFSSGYEESISKSSPDRLPISIDKQSYSIGDMVRVNITPKFSGPIMVSVANHDLIETKKIEAVAGQKIEVTFSVKKSWGSSPYILATAFRAESKKLGANRAIGLSHLEVIDPEQMIDLIMRYHKKVKSLHSTKVTIFAKDMADEKPITKDCYLTLAAVDDAVLRLTNYRSPDPKSYFFGQQKLGIEIRDLYSSLIKTTGEHGKFNVGAGDIGLDEMKYNDSISNRRKVVSIMSDRVEFDQDGKAEITLDIPDYQGSLRLMAVAWSDNAVGATSGDMVVKDIISPEIYLPKFISVGDRVESLVSVDFDIEAEAGEYQITVTDENSLQRISKKSYKFNFDGSKPAKFTTPVTIKAPSLHDNHIKIEIAKGDEILTTKEWDLAVRAKYPQAHVRRVGLVDTQATLNTKDLLNTSVWSDINSIYLHLSGKALLPTNSIANELIEYGGRCAEQTTSRAMPWLFMPQNMAHSQAINRQAIIQSAIDRLLNYQKIDGGFGLWSSSAPSVWVSSYVLDFLTRAKRVGYSVPDKNIKAGLDWLENSLDKWSGSQSKEEADAYALYVLTRSGRILMSEMMFHAKNRDSEIKSAQAWGHLAASFALVGEKELAIALFKKAKKSLNNYHRGYYYYSNYGGGLRDEASLVSLMIESKLDIDWQSSFTQLALNAKDRVYLSTQEMSLLLKASYLSSIKPTKLSLSSGGKPLPLKDGEYEKYAKNIDALLDVTNNSNNKVWYSVSYKATPIAQSYSDIEDNGFSITKKIYHMDGTLADLDQIEQNSRLVVVLEGKIENNNIDNPLVTDWVISGFELENPNINGIDATTTLDWVGSQTPMEHVEYRDDRYVAAFDPYVKRDGKFRLAYVVRAVTKGRFALPPTRIEDMYQPAYRAYSKIRLSPVDIVSKADIKSSQSKSSVKTTTLVEDDYIYANSKPITDVGRYTIVDLNFLRNGIFAHNGLDFEKINPMLHKLFSKFSWYHPSPKSSAIIYRGLSRLQKDNIQRLLSEEKRRGGSLVLADFYLVNNKLLVADDLKKYNKEQLYILRNSLFARHGVKFKNKKLSKIFGYMPWYRPTDVTSSIVFDEIMSEQEKSNVKLMQNLERS
jgi:uncharacterized protein YfaS (alpha-2-macroglobulin family)